MIIEEILSETLVRHYSDSGYRIRQTETSAVYDEAVDAIPCQFSYEETETLVDDETTIEDKAEAYDILMGVSE